MYSCFYYQVLDARISMNAKRKEFAVKCATICLDLLDALVSKDIRWTKMMGKHLATFLNCNKIIHMIITGLASLRDHDRLYTFPHKTKSAASYFPNRRSFSRSPEHPPLIRPSECLTTDSSIECFTHRSPKERKAFIMSMSVKMSEGAF